MSILAENDGLLVLAVLDTLFLGVLGHSINCGIHITIHMCRLGLHISLIVNESRWISFSSILEHLSVVVTIESLVTETPHDNTGVILITVKNSPDTVKVGVLPLGIVGGELGSLSESKLL